MTLDFKKIKIKKKMQKKKENDPRRGRESVYSRSKGKRSYS
jgi:hypothetical protein